MSCLQVINISRKRTEEEEVSKKRIIYLKKSQVQEELFLHSRGSDVIYCKRRLS
jgi:hypothetical protein